MGQVEHASVDIAVIGAGPAGMAATVRAAEAGVRVALFDEHAQPGGVVWRGLLRSGHRVADLTGDQTSGKAVLRRLDEAEVLRLSGATVWEVTRDHLITYSQAGIVRQLKAQRIILATGALERPMPFAGWTLPGVMTAGGAQMMLKTSGLAPAGPVVMAGSGPLLYLVAKQLSAAGQPPAAIVDTTPAANRKTALRYLPLRLTAWRPLVQGLKWQRALQRVGVAIYRQASNLKACGDGRISRFGFKSMGKDLELACGTLLLHNGLVPNAQLSRAIGLDHDWNGFGQAWQPRTDRMGRCGIDGFFIAGDGAGIAGADAAIHSGRLAAMAALEGLTETSATEAGREMKSLARLRAMRRFLDNLFAPAAEFLRPGDDVIVCRCEEVTAGQIRQLVAQGCQDPNAIKSLGRAGMGPCQGRYCGLTVGHLVAEMRQVSVAEAGYFRLRFPAKPLTLGELASLKSDEAANGR